MTQYSVKGEVVVDQASGDVKVVSKTGRLSFPVQVIESNTRAKKQVKNYQEFLRLIREIKRANKNAVSKRTVIQEKINLHLRKLQIPA